MCKKLLLSSFLVLIFVGIKAQQGSNQLSLGGEAAIPVYQHDHGFGLFVKGLYGVGSKTQLSLSVGISRLRPNDAVEQGDITTRLIPVLLGYRLNLHQFFIEPQLGLGELGGNIKTDGDYARPSVAAFFGAFNAGYIIKRCNAGIRFQMAHGIEGNSAGTWHDQNFHYTSIFIGYAIFSSR